QIREAPAEGAPLLYIDRVYSRRPSAEGVIVDGRVRRGTIRRRAQLAALGLGQRLALVVAELERGRHKVEQAEAGQFTGLRLIRLGGPLGPDELRTGQALVKPETPEVRRFT